MRILNFFDMEYLSGSSHRPNECHIQLGSAVWLGPPEGFLKLNFDGASKMNLGKERAGGVIRDLTDKISILYFIDIGQASNNAT